MKLFWCKVVRHKVDGNGSNDYLVDFYIITALVALFALPKIYESNKNVIDQYVDLVWAKVSEINSK